MLYGAHKTAAVSKYYIIPTV